MDRGQFPAQSGTKRERRGRNKSFSEVESNDREKDIPTIHNIADALTGSEKPKDEPGLSSRVSVVIQPFAVVAMVGKMETPTSKPTTARERFPIVYAIAGNYNGNPHQQR